uniref:Coiled-coil domain-containing protein 80 n=1 Tax=Nothobranchius kadleci TaxID=1051664 RepID=A0A1A8CT09_NOTKA
MRGVVCLGLVLVHLLSWTGADKQNRVKLRETDKERAGRLRAGFGSASSYKVGVQAEEGVSGRPGSRRPGGEGASPWRGGSGRLQDEGTPGSRAKISSSTGSPNLLASFAGKNRVLVISAPHESDGYFRMMMSLLKPDVYCELAERHVHQIIMFHQEGELGGKVRRVSTDGRVLEEPLDTALIPRLMSFLKLDKGKFGMVLLKKTLQVEEKYPYPVRLEAMYEVIDQSPIRKLEKVRQKGFVQKCKAAGVEGQVEEGTLPAPDPPPERKPLKKTSRKPTQTVTTSTTTTTTTTRATTTAKPTTTSTRRLTTTTQTVTQAQTTAMWLPAPRTTADPYYTLHPNNHRERFPPKTTPAGNNRTDKDNRYPPSRKLVPFTHKPPKIKPTNKKNRGEKMFVETYEPSVPTEKDLEKMETVTNIRPTKRVKSKHEKKKSEDPLKKGDRKGKPSKEGKNRGKKNGKKLPKYPENQDHPKPTKRPAVLPKNSLPDFLDYFENKRRLLLITSLTEDNTMYVQQKDEYLESVCEMAIRKVSIITIFGSLTNSTMKIDHYQIENDKPMKGLRQEDLMNQDLIMDLRKRFGMTYEEFYMVLTDIDMRVKQSYEVPIAMKAVFDYIDTFSSRIHEMEQQKRDGIVCKKEDKPRSLENFLSRFRWRRRLFIISAPSDEEWSYQQQLYALTSQACNLGLRHIAILKLVGTELPDIGGVLELYPINGTATVEREGLSATLVKDMRNYFQISPEYFSMLLVGKDGNVKSWYPSPMWSMANIYDLVDSMQLRRQEMAIQQSLGMRCPEDEYGGYGYHQHGYEHGYQDGYHQGY